jgi:cholesterol oxidase
VRGTLAVDVRARRDRYDEARRMFGVVRYPYMPTDVDRYMQQVATDMGRGNTFNKAPVGV